MFPHKLSAFTWHDQFDCSCRIRMPLRTTTQVRDDGGSQQSGKGYEMLRLFQWWKLRAFSSGLEVRYEGEQSRRRSSDPWMKWECSRAEQNWLGREDVNFWTRHVGFCWGEGASRWKCWSFKEKKKRRMDTSLRKKFKVTRQKRVLKEIEYRLSC